MESLYPQATDPHGRSDVTPVRPNGLERVLAGPIPLHNHIHPPFFPHDQRTIGEDDYFANIRSSVPRMGYSLTPDERPSQPFVHSWPRSYSSDDSQLRDGFRTFTGSSASSGLSAAAVLVPHASGPNIALPPPQAPSRWTLAGSLDPRTGIFYRTSDHPRQRTAQACEKCRARKAKCSGSFPSCERCLSRSLVCEYSEVRTRGANRQRNNKNVNTKTDPDPSKRRRPRAADPSDKAEITTQALSTVPADDGEKGPELLTAPLPSTSADRVKKTDALDEPMFTLHPPHLKMAADRAQMFPQVSPIPTSSVSGDLSGFGAASYVSERAYHLSQDAPHAYVYSHGSPSPEQHRQHQLTPLSIPSQYGYVTADPQTELAMSSPQSWTTLNSPSTGSVISSPTSPSSSSFCSQHEMTSYQQHQYGCTAPSAAWSPTTVFLHGYPGPEREVEVEAEGEGTRWLQQKGSPLAPPL